MNCAQNLVSRLQTAEKTLSETLAATQRKLAEKSAEMLQQRQDMLEQMQKQREQLQEKHQSELDAMIQENLEETRGLNAEFQKARDMMSDRYSLLEQRYELPLNFCFVLCDILACRFLFFCYGT